MGSAIFTAVASGAATVYTHRGAWAASTAYAVNDLVLYGGSTYLVKTAHTSATGATPDVTTANYQMFVQGSNIVQSTTQPALGSGLIWIDSN